MINQCMVCGEVYENEKTCPCPPPRLTRSRLPRSPRLGQDGRHKPTPRKRTTHPENERTTMQNLQEMFSSVSHLFALRNPRTNKIIKFELKRHQNKYVYYQAKNGAQYCYTPHKDTEGWYYSFAYIPKGPGSRTGKAKRWTMKKLRPHRTRKAARTRALAMLQKGPRTNG